MRSSVGYPTRRRLSWRSRLRLVWRSAGVWSVVVWRWRRFWRKRHWRHRLSGFRCCRESSRSLAHNWSSRFSRRWSACRWRGAVRRLSCARCLRFVFAKRFNPMLVSGFLCCRTDLFAGLRESRWWRCVCFRRHDSCCCRQWRRATKGVHGGRPPPRGDLTSDSGTAAAAARSRSSCVSSSVSAPRKLRVPSISRPRGALILKIALVAAC